MQNINTSTIEQLPKYPTDEWHGSSMHNTAAFIVVMRAANFWQGNYQFENEHFSKAANCSETYSRPKGSLWDVKFAPPTTIKLTSYKHHSERGL